MTLPTQSTQPSSVQSQHFLLKWNNHRSNMVNVFESLLQSENLVDVTIAVEGKFIKAHKIVLSACSPYFQAMFVNHSPSERYPVLIFHDMKHAHLKTLLDFMYRGEISIDEKDLGEVLKVAEALSIRGLSSFESDDEEDKPEGQNNSTSSSNNANSNNANQSSSSTLSNNNTSSHHGNSSNANSTGINSQGQSSNPSTNSQNSNNNGLTDNASNISSSEQCTNGRDNGSSPNNSVTNNSNHVNMYSPVGRNGTNGKESSNSNVIVGRKQKRGADRKKDNQYKREISPISHHHHSHHQIHPNSISAIAQQLDKAVVESKIFEKKHHQQNLLKGQQQDKARSLSPPVKKKRGRPKSKPSEIESGGNHQALPNIQVPSSSSKLMHSLTEVKRGSSSVTSSVSTPGRQGVRRRLPRRFSGVPTRLKRVKLNKSGSSGNASGNGNNSGGGGFGGDGDGPLLDDGVLFDPNGGDCEPLSEMSVRGLDLFKYASVEDGLYRCIECEKLSIPKTFKNKYSFQRHAFLYHEGNMRKVFPCPVCSREFSRPDKMKNHMKGVHEGSGAKGGGGKGSPSEVSREDEEANSSAEVITKVEQENSDGGEISDEAEDRDEESCDYEG